MNQLRSWLYGRDVQRILPQDHGQNQEDKPLISAHDRNSMEKFDSSTPKNSHISETEVTDSLLRRLLLKVVPLQPGDCLGCKLVGTTVMAASGVIVITSAIAGRTRNPNLQRNNRLLYNVVCGSLFIGCEAAAISRFFDIGPFAKIVGYQRQTKQE